MYSTAKDWIADYNLQDLICDPYQDPMTASAAQIAIAANKITDYARGRLGVEILGGAFEVDRAIRVRIAEYARSIYGQSEGY